MWKPTDSGQEVFQEEARMNEWMKDMCEKQKV